MKVLGPNECCNDDILVAKGSIGRLICVSELNLLIGRIHLLGESCIGAWTI